MVEPATGTSLDTEVPTGDSTTTVKIVELKPDKGAKGVVLPPREEWPPVIRPALRGRVRVLEDHPLVGHKVKVVKKKSYPTTTRSKEPRPRKCQTTTATGVDKASSVGSPEMAQGILNQLLPLLNGWLRQNLEALGLKGPERMEIVEESTPPPTSRLATGQTQSAHPGPVTSGPPPPHSGNQKSQRQQPSAVVAGPVALPEQEWRTVLGRKERRREALKKPTLKEKGNKSAPVQGTGKKVPIVDRKASKGGDSQRKTSTTSSSKKRKPPRTAAVSLSCPQDQYSDAMRKAREAINLEEIGINILRPKRAANGALVLEIPGPDGATKAEALKNKLSEAFKNDEGVKVVVPTKMADIRLKDVVDPDDKEGLLAAIASVNGDKPDNIKIGPSRRTAGGLFSVLAQCPLVTANKMLEDGRIKIDWMTSRVELLPPRQARCFRCLEGGHVQINCKSPTDRSALCYHCSQPGHVARDCENPPRCEICQTVGRDSSHRMGGNACKTPSRKALKKMRKQSRSAVRGGPSPEVSGATPVPVRPDTGESRKEEMMEVEPAPPSPQILPKKKKLEMDREESDKRPRIHP